MIVAMQDKATEEQIDAVIDAMEEAGVDVHRTTGELQTILAGVGPTAGLDLTKFEMLPGVLTCTVSARPTSWPAAPCARKAPWSSSPMARRSAAEQVAIIAGPCALRIASISLKSPHA